MSTQFISQYPKHIVECLTTLALVVLALLLTTRASGTGTWLAQLSFLALAAYRILPAMQQVFFALVKLRANRPAFESIAGDLLAARAREQQPPADPADRPPMELRHQIRLRSVTFGYAGDAPPVFRDLDLEIPAGSMVGLVGENGSGKTTIADIVAGLLVVDSGSVEVDGVPIVEVNRAEWMARVAYVPQNIFLMDASVAENIALGVPAARINRQRLNDAIRMASLERCIGALPRGGNEPIGERGERLSGGQRQRIGIARALYREAALLILDESTSALDTEQEIMEALNALRGRCTILLITHRLATLHRCDLIFELTDGKLVRHAKRGASNRPLAREPQHEGS